MTDAYILDAVRTPFGRYGGALAGVRPDDLAASTLKALVERTPALDPADIDDVILGNANGAGEDNRDVARMAVAARGAADARARRGGQPVVRVLARGDDPGLAGDRGRRRARRRRRRRRVDDAARRGSCSSPPRASRPATRRCTRRRSAGAWSTRRCPSSGRSRSARRPRSWPTSTTSRATTRTRSRCAPTGSRPRRGTRGVYDGEVVAGPGRRPRARRGHPRRHVAGEARQAEGRVRRTAGRSRPATRRRSTTARRCSCSATRPRRRGWAATRWRAWCRAPRTASTPTSSASARSRRPTGRCERAGIGWGDLAAVELNEAFASQSLACLRQWPELDPEIVNVRGGAIAIGHPLGAIGRADRRAARPRAARPRRRVRSGRDLHRRRPGTGGGAACMMSG